MLSFVRTERRISRDACRLLGSGEAVAPRSSKALQPGQVIAGRKAFVLKAELGKGDAGHDH